jgi:hypothetical protein
MWLYYMGFFFHFWDYKKLMIFFNSKICRTYVRKKFPNFFGEKTTIFFPKNTEIYVYL